MPETAARCVAALSLAHFSSSIASWVPSGKSLKVHHHRNTLKGLKSDGRNMGETQERSRGAVYQISEHVRTSFWIFLALCVGPVILGGILHICTK